MVIPQPEAIDDAITQLLHNRSNELQTALYHLSTYAARVQASKDHLPVKIVHDVELGFLLGLMTAQINARVMAGLAAFSPAAKAGARD